MCECSLWVVCWLVYEYLITLFTYCKYRNARQNLSNVLQCIQNEGLAFDCICSAANHRSNRHKAFVLAMKIQGMDIWIIAVGFQIHFTKPANHWSTIQTIHWENIVAILRVCKSTDLPSDQKLPCLMIDCWNVLTREGFYETIMGIFLNLLPLRPCNLDQCLKAGWRRDLAPPEACIQERV